ncbi:MAG TPA: aspartyl protease family protein [Candidatus Binatus sp.]|nr:aspartyl protease family protein [Candidatus Binatus sp.]
MNGYVPADRNHVKTIWSALLICCAAMVFGRAIPSLLLMGQEPPTKTAGATAPGASSGVSGSSDAGTICMRALQEGIKNFRAENFKAAALSLETAVAVHASGPPTAHAYAWLARTYLHLHRVSDAEDASQKAVDTGKELANAQTALAEVYFREGKMAEAEHVLLGLVKNQSATPRTYLGLANIHWATANYKSARTLIELAHKDDTSDPDIRESWMRSLTPRERVEEWKRRLAEGKYEDDQERQGLAAGIAVAEDRRKNENRSCKLLNKLNATQTKLVQHMLDPHRYSSYDLGVKLNGVNAQLELDTGAGGILVSSRIAEKAGLAKVADNLIGGIGDKGAAKGYVAFADKLQIGELEFQNCYVDVVDKKRALDVDGLIGADVFENYLIDIDFPNSMLRLSQLPPYPDQTGEQTSLESEQTVSAGLHDRWVPPQYKDFETVYRFGHMLLLPVQLNKAPYRLFLLDTGAWDNTLSPAAAREASKLHKDYDLKVKGLSGEVQTVYTTGEVMLTFGRFRQKRSDLVAFDLSNMSNHIGTEVSGALGFAMLYLLDIKLDYRDNLVDFEYDPNRFH